MVNKPKGDGLMTVSEFETKEVAPHFFYFQWKQISHFLGIRKGVMTLQVTGRKNLEDE